MMSKKGLPIVGVILICGLFFGFKSMGGSGDDNSPAKQEKILRSVATLLKEKHYSPKNINDAFSRTLFRQYLSDLDPEKNIFTEADIQSLKKFETSIDEEINGGKVEFFNAVNAIYEKRLSEVVSIYKEILAKPFDFTANEKVQLDQDKLKYTSDAERRETWRKRLKYMALERYSDLLELRENNKGKDSFVVKTDVQLEKEARDRVLKVMDRNFDRIKARFTADERFNMYINSMSELMDHNTSYFPPVEKRAFEEQMSGRFYGIGAQLREDEGAIKVVSLVTGSPAWKSGEIQINDAILKVAQGQAEPTDLAGFAVEDAVKLIRGTKGTEVRLTVRKSDGSVKVVTLVRDEIIQDETYARSAIISQSGNKIGYIYLPEFYADFEKPDGKRCSMDVAAEVMKLKGEKVDGIILDLRNNGGGYLYEAVDIVGLFIKDGPVVQVRDRDGKNSVIEDRNNAVLYDGPLTIMVNELSASASEILAAAIQDYKRGIIVGSNSTYGKGTVQRVIPFGRPVDFLTGSTDLGALKLTLQKYYRVNGGSVQARGIVPDVVIPDVYQFLKIRERDNENAMPWDEIENSRYKTWSSSIDFEAVKRAAADRINANPVFSNIHKNAEWLSKNADREYDLNLAKYREKQKQIRSTVKANDSLTRLKTELDVAALELDRKKFFENDDKAKGERYQQWLKSLRTDIYIDEAAKVMSDMINSQKGLALNK